MGVNIGSMYGVVGSYPPVYEGISSASPVSYHATKGAIVQLTRHLAVYWAKDRVRVNCLCPGADWRGVSEEDFYKDLGNCTACFSLARLMRNHLVARNAPGSIAVVRSCALLMRISTCPANSTADANAAGSDAMSS